MTLDASLAERLTRNADGLFTVVVQEHSTGDVLMVAWMDDEALDRTMRTRRATYWSRSRSEYWVKGETSGHTQYVHRIQLDCDGDALLMTVDQVGAACHTGTHTCFDDRTILPEQAATDTVTPQTPTTQTRTTETRTTETPTTQTRTGS